MPAGVQNLDILMARLLTKLRSKDSLSIHKGTTRFDGVRLTAKPVRGQASFNSINFTSPLKGDVQEFHKFEKPFHQHLPSIGGVPANGFYREF